MTIYLLHRSGYSNYSRTLSWVRNDMVYYLNIQMLERGIQYYEEDGFIDSSGVTELKRRSL